MVASDRNSRQQSSRDWRDDHRNLGSRNWAGDPGPPRLSPASSEPALLRSLSEGIQSSRKWKADCDPVLPPQCPRAGVEGVIAISEASRVGEGQPSRIPRQSHPGSERSEDMQGCCPSCTDLPRGTTADHFVPRPCPAGEPPSRTPDQPWSELSLGTLSPGLSHCLRYCSRQTTPNPII